MRRLSRFYRALGSWKCVLTGHVMLVDVWVYDVGGTNAVRVNRCDDTIPSYSCRTCCETEAYV
jgi:hypothetical protein